MPLRADLLDASEEEEYDATDTPKTFFQVLRPPCDAAVLHQVRIELLLGVIPIGSALLIMGAAIRGELSSCHAKMRSIAIQNLVISPLLLVVGLLWKDSPWCVGSLWCFLEDPRRSDYLLSCMSYYVLLVLNIPSLLLGGADDIIDSLVVNSLGFFLLYVPVLSNAWTPTACMACYSICAVARLFHIRAAQPMTSVVLQGFQWQAILMMVLTHVGLRIRAIHLSLRRTPLTASCLQDHRRLCDNEAELAGQLIPRRRRITLLKPNYTVCRGEHSLKILKGLQMRRRESKQQVVTQVLWSLHVLSAGTLNEGTVMLILQFVDPTLSPADKCYGLLAEDGMSQVSTLKSRTAMSLATSSATSVTILQRRLLRALCIPLPSWRAT